MATLNTYGELKAQIESWMLASSEITASADLVVRLSQPYINLKLRAREMLTVADITVNGSRIALPNGYLAYRRVVVIYGDRRIPLKFVSLDKSDEMYPFAVGGTPRHFTVIGNYIQVFPVQADGTQVELTYYTRLEQFQSDDASDWLLASYPNIYLAAGQMYAAEFIKENEEAQKQAAICDVLISMVNAQDEQSEYSEASEFIPADVPV